MVFIHSHKCRHCADNFVCVYGADDCFASQITCDDCFRSHEAKWVWLGGGMIVAVIATVITLLRFFKF